MGPPKNWLDESAVRLDWMLACEDTEQAIQAAVARRNARRNAQRPSGPMGGGFNVG